MASKQPLKLFDIKMMGVRTWLRLKYFTYHSILMQKKNLLLIGDDKSELYQKITQRLGNKWHVQTITQPSLSQSNGNQIMNHYLNVQKNLKSKGYQAIVVLPETQSQENIFNIEDEGLVTKFPNFYLNSIIRNVFAYKIASKYLQKTGVIILSCNEKEFYDLNPFQYEQYGRGKQKISLKSNPYEKYSISHCLSDGPIAYLGLIIGERYELNLNSNSIIALSSEQSATESQTIAKYYYDWMNRRNLPQPGSFARFIRSDQKFQAGFVEYL